MNIERLEKVDGQFVEDIFRYFYEGDWYSHPSDLNQLDATAAYLRRELLLVLGD